MGHGTSREYVGSPLVCAVSRVATENDRVQSSDQKRSVRRALYVTRHKIHLDRQAGEREKERERGKERIIGEREMDRESEREDPKEEERERQMNGIDE